MLDIDPHTCTYTCRYVHNDYPLQCYNVIELFAAMLYFKQSYNLTKY